MPATPLPPERLRRRCDPKAFPFSTTQDLDLPHKAIGQPRAFRALTLGRAVRGRGFNVFVLGLPGSGRTSLVLDFLREQARQEPTPPDLVYVYNFKAPRRPRALRFPPGRARAFAADMDALVRACRRALRKTFQSEKYQQSRERIQQEVQRKQEETFQAMQQKAKEAGFALMQTPMGFLLVPVKDDRPVKLEELPEEERTRLEQARKQLEEEVKKTLRRLRQLERKGRKAEEKLEAQVAAHAVEHLFEEMKEKYADVEGVAAYLDQVQEDVVENRGMFLREFTDQAQEEQWRYWARRYKVNVLVDNGDLEGAPVVMENHPSYPNLLGRIEHEVIMGVTRTDHTLIQPGALHRAAGGYLVLPARDVLLHPYAWEGLKRALREERIRIIELAAEMGILSTVTLEPEPMPLETKVVLIGTPLLYYLLRLYDEDFAKLFKVRAEFAPDMPRTPETEQEYALFARSVQARYDLPPLDASAVARLVELGSRLAEHQERLTTRFGLLADLLREAAYWAEQNGRTTITEADLRQAEAERIYRANYVEERIRESILEGTLRVQLEGRAVGQINGLAVHFLGDYAFGRPVRITATAYPGRGEVVDIEKQAELGDPIHTKGVLILGGYLGKQYAALGPLNLTARLTFEQSYSPVEGDSASAAELLALLSAIAQVPLRQDVAITGSVDQHGNIQAIGGVNEKIEGFFAVCKARGLTGTQGVVIPKANERHLMLRDEVVDAVRQGRFHVWSVEHIDEAIELFTGMPAGTAQEDGTFPEGTFHHAVVRGLQAFAQQVRQREDDDETPDQGASEGQSSQKPQGGEAS